jgi:hypothetical protein
MAGQIANIDLLDLDERSKLFMTQNRVIITRSRVIASAEA